MSFIVVIPARYQSTRLPGKPLADIHGKPMILRVAERALQAGAERVIVATDDQRVADAVAGAGVEVCMTSPDHQSGTERLAEVCRHYGFADDTIIVNVQGDEPMIPPAIIGQVAHNLAHSDAPMATLAVPMTADEVFNPNAVKVVRDEQGYALYFSRAPIPWRRGVFQIGAAVPTELPNDAVWFRHIGLYAYRVAVLRRYPYLTPAPAEQAESLEQLRALWHGIRIYVAEAGEAPPPGIDTEADLARAEAEWECSG